MAIPWGHGWPNMPAMASPLAFVPSSPLGDALVILGAAGLVIPIFARFRITPVIGFIMVGLLVGPFGLGSLVSEQPWLAYVTISDPERLGERDQESGREVRERAL